MFRLFLLILPTLLLSSYGQLVTKWRVTELMGRQTGDMGKLDRLQAYVADPYILSAYAFSFLSSVAWMYVIEKFPVSVAFPAYMGMLFVVVSLGSSLMLKEAVTLQQMAGMALIAAGVFVISRV